MSLDDISSKTKVDKSFKWPPVDLKNIESKYICSQCKNILQNAHQADDCCCRFCLHCLNSIIENGNGKCPKCNSKLISTLRIPDNMFQKKINKIEVKCEFIDPIACEWKGTLSEYKIHYNQHFEAQTKTCEYCKIEFKSKKEFDLHLDKENGDCSKQLLECPFTFIGCDGNNCKNNSMETSSDTNETNSFTRESLKEHKIKKSSEHLELVFNYLSNRIESLYSEYLKYGSNSSDLLRPNNHNQVTDEFGAGVGLNLNQFRNQFKKISNESEIKFDQFNDNTKFIDLITKIDMLENNQKILIDDLTRLTLMYDNLKQENVKYREGVDKYKTICQDLHRSLALTQVSLLTLEERIVNQEKISYNGTLLWKITNVNERIQEAKSGRQTSFYSPPFYTDRNGFKMCARIYLNGDGNGRNTHLSLFFVILRGENDALLQWPFRQKVSFILIDQSTSESRENIFDAFRPDPNSTSFRRPLSEMNIASGLPVFCPLGKLLSDDHEYIKDNTIFIKIIVDTKDLPEI